MFKTVEIIAETKEQIEKIKQILKDQRQNSNLEINSKVSKMPDTVKESASNGSTGIYTKNSELQVLLQAIPEYWPGQNLHLFINEVDNLVTYLSNKLTPDLVYVFNFSIRSKIKGEARDYVSYQGVTEWNDIRKTLLQKYGDQRSEDLLVSALTQCVQKRGETYLDFYGKLLQEFNGLMQNITLNTSDTNYLTYKRLEYGKLALKTFQIGLLEPHRSFLGNFELETIEQCLEKCRLLDNRKTQWDYCEFIRRSQDGNALTKKIFGSSSHNPNPMHNSLNSKPHSHLQGQSQTKLPTFQQPTQKSFNNFNQKPRSPFPQFPNFKQPNQPNQNHNGQKNFFPKPVFGNGPVSQPQRPPEPMSVQSRISNSWRPRPLNTFHQNLAPKNSNFRFQELHNVETDHLPNENDFCEDQDDNPEFENPYDAQFCENNTFPEFEESDVNFQEPASTDGGT